MNDIDINEEVLSDVSKNLNGIMSKLKELNNDMVSVDFSDLICNSEAIFIGAKNVVNNLINGSNDNSLSDLITRIDTTRNIFLGGNDETIDFDIYDDSYLYAIQDAKTTANFLNKDELKLMLENGEKENYDRMNPPVFIQHYYEGIPYGNYKLSTHGCGLCSLATAISLRYGVKFEPDLLAKWYGEYCYKNGSDYKLVERVADDFDIELKDQFRMNSNNDLSKVKEYLEEGYTIVVTVGKKSVFTEGSHYIALTGITEDGKVIVADSSMYNHAELLDYNPGNYGKPATLKDGFKNGFDLSEFSSGKVFNCWVLAGPVVEKTAPNFGSEQGGIVEPSENLVPNPKTEDDKTTPDSVPEPKTENDGTAPNPAPEPKTENEGTAPNPAPEPKTENEGTAPNPAPEPKTENDRTTPNPVPEPKTENDRTTPNPVPEPKTENDRTTPNPVPEPKTENDRTIPNSKTEYGPTENLVPNPKTEYGPTENLVPNPKTEYGPTENLVPNPKTEYGPTSISDEKSDINQFVVPGVLGTTGGVSLFAKVGELVKKNKKNKDI